MPVRTGGLNGIDRSGPNWHLQKKHKDAVHYNSSNPEQFNPTHTSTFTKVGGFDRFFDPKNPPSPRQIGPKYFPEKEQAVERGVPVGGEDFGRFGKRPLTAPESGTMKAQGRRYLKEPRPIDSRGEKGVGRKHYVIPASKTDTLSDRMGKMGRPINPATGKERREERSGLWGLEDICAPKKPKPVVPVEHPGGTQPGQNFRRLDLREPILFRVGPRVFNFRKRWLHKNEEKEDWVMPVNPRDNFMDTELGHTVEDPHGAVPGYTGFVRGKAYVLGQTAANISRMSKTNCEEIFRSNLEGPLGDSKHSFNTIGSGDKEAIEARKEKYSVAKECQEVVDTAGIPPGYGGYRPGGEHLLGVRHGDASKRLEGDEDGVYNYGLFNPLEDGNRTVQPAMRERYEGPVIAQDFLVPKCVDPVPKRPVTAGPKTHKGLPVRKPSQASVVGGSRPNTANSRELSKSRAMRYEPERTAPPFDRYKPPVPPGSTVRPSTAAPVVTRPWEDNEDAQSSRGPTPQQIELANTGTLNVVNVSGLNVQPGWWKVASKSGHYTDVVQCNEGIYRRFG